MAKSSHAERKPVQAGTDRWVTEGTEGSVYLEVETIKLICMSSMNETLAVTFEPITLAITF